MGAVGRPRRFDAADERRLVLDAAFTVMARNGYQDVAVADILAEAGISTRSFYRHFGSKDELLRAMCRREADAAAAAIAEKVAAAGSPRAGLEAWIDEILSYGQHRGKARRAAVLGSAGAMRAEGFADEMARAFGLLTVPLLDVLEAGRADGTFPHADPPADALQVQALAWRASGLNPFAEARPATPETREAVLDFCLRALGAPPWAGGA
jgi:AcrR family transcriptional regulator